MRTAGFISDQLTENPVKVNYTWYDKSSGIVQWNFENMVITWSMAYKGLDSGWFPVVLGTLSISLAFFIIFHYEIFILYIPENP